MAVQPIPERDPLTPELERELARPGPAPWTPPDALLDYCRRCGRPVRFAMSTREAQASAYETHRTLYHPEPTRDAELGELELRAMWGDR